MARKQRRETKKGTMTATKEGERAYKGSQIQLERALEAIERIKGYLRQWVSETAGRASDILAGFK